MMVCSHNSGKFRHPGRRSWLPDSVTILTASWENPEDVMWFPVSRDVESEEILELLLPH